MADIPMEVEALTAYYQKIGITEARAFMCAWDTWDDIRAGKPVDAATLAAVPDPVRDGLTSKVQFTNKGRQSFVIPPEEAYQNITPRTTQKEAKRTYSNKKPGQDLAASINIQEGGNCRVTRGLVVDGEGYVLGKYENKEDEAPSNLGKTFTFMPGEVYPEEKKSK